MNGQKNELSVKDRKQLAKNKKNRGLPSVGSPRDI